MVNRNDCCQFLLSSHINFTMTHFADHSQGFSHDAVNRLLCRDKLTGCILWEHVQGDIVPSPRGCLVFDDSVLNKENSYAIELVRLQYSGNEHGMVNCLYVNPDTGQYWIVDYRILNPEGDGKRKLDHVQEMLTLAIVARPCLSRTCCLTAGMPPRT